MDDMNTLLNSLKEVPAMPNVIMHALNVATDFILITQDVAVVMALTLRKLKI
jgi:hypothetical protein